MAEWDKIFELDIIEKRVAIHQVNEKNINNSKWAKDIK